MQWTLANWHWVNVVLSPAHYPSPPLDLPLMMLAVTFIEKFKVKTLELVVLNQLSSFLSNIIYWMLTNQDSDVDIQLRLCYSQSLKPCELQKLIPNHQFSSAGSICYFWHCQSSDPPVHPLITGHHWDSTSLVWILSHWSVFQGGLGRGGIRRTLTGHWGSSGIGSWTPPLLHINCITGSHHTSTWFLIPLLCWWDTALPLVSTRWSNGSCTDLRLPGGHLGMDERTPSTAQPGKDFLSLLPLQLYSMISPSS